MTIYQIRQGRIIIGEAHNREEVDIALTQLRETFPLRAYTLWSVTQRQIEERE